MKVIKGLEVAFEEEYSNLSLAFYKLHGIREGFLSGRNAQLKKEKFLDSLIKNLDAEAIEKGVYFLENSIKSATSGYVSQNIKATIGYRFITGMGYPSPVENGMLFHHVYGVPYIHGESVKGLVRYTYLLKKFPELFEKPKEFKDYIKELEEGEYKKDKDLQNEYSLIFGSKKREGSIIFFDAYPTELTKANLAIDIMNPHYGEYYRNKGQKPAVEWDKPNPIFFLALENVEFCFAVGFDPLILDEKEGNEILKKVFSYLKGGLEMFGLGGKRRKGYGWFSVKKK